MKDPRPSPIAGTWYPRDIDTLTQSIDEQLEAAEVKLPPGEVIGIVAPHAGHRYSGFVAAHAFRCLQGLAPDLVIMLSPLHEAYLGELFTSAHDAYSTPLGNIPIYVEGIDQLRDVLRGQVNIKRIRNDQEHAIEIELPFLQRVLRKPFLLLPIMLREQSQEVAQTLGIALAEMLKGQKAVLVASSDLSHFHPAELAKQLDQQMLSQIEAFDPAGVLKADQRGHGYACGRGAIAAALWAAQGLGANQVNVLAYAHSGTVTGDHQSVVGYGAAVIFRDN